MTRIQKDKKKYFLTTPPAETQSFQSIRQVLNIDFSCNYRKYTSIIIDEVSEERSHQEENEQVEKWDTYYKKLN